MYQRAILRRPGPEMKRGITTAKLGLPDFALAQEQFRIYVRTLLECGVVPEILPDDAEFPDGCFVEDTAIITEQLAIITRPGHPARARETEHMAQVLRAYRPLSFITTPGTLDGGDVIRAGNHFIIGLSDRTSGEGAGQLAALLSAQGFTSETVQVKKGLHLKSSVTYAGEGKMLVTEAGKEMPFLRNYELLVIPNREAYAANCLNVNGTVIAADGFPHTRKILEKHFPKTRFLNLSEFRKLDGSITCLSLLF